jgi:hypothetical protein
MNAQYSQQLASVIRVVSKNGGRIFHLQGKRLSPLSRFTLEIHLLAYSIFFCCNMFLLKVLVKRAGQPMSTACPHGMGNGSRSINDDIASVSSPALAAVVCAHTIRRHSSNRGFQLNAVQLGDRAACMHARRSIA